MSVSLLRNNNGSLLIEVLLTVIVVSVSLTLVIGGLLAGYRASIRYQDDWQSMMVLENQLARWNAQIQGDLRASSDIALEIDSKYLLDFSEQTISEHEGHALKAVKLNLQWPVGQRTLNRTLVTWIETHDK